MTHTMSGAIERDWHSRLHGLTAWLIPGRARERELLQLAGEVESESPGLACELRGIARHEASVASHGPARDPTWRRAGRAIWGGLSLLGWLRAQRELRRLVEQWEVTDPALARQLREALERGPAD
jgi:hypothetical protein